MRSFSFDSPRKLNNLNSNRSAAFFNEKNIVYDHLVLAGLMKFMHSILSVLTPSTCKLLALHGTVLSELQGLLTMLAQSHVLHLDAP